VWKKEKKKVTEEKKEKKESIDSVPGQRRQTLLGRRGGLDLPQRKKEGRGTEGFFSAQKVIMTPGYFQRGGEKSG